MQAAKHDMDDFRRSLPPAGELVTRGVQAVVAGLQLLLAHASLNRVGTVLGLEGELKKDNRVPKDGGLGGALGCAQRIYRTSGVLGLLRGLAPHALYFAGTMGVQHALRSTSLGRMLLPYFDQTASTPMTVTRLALLPLATGLLFWPARALRNAIQSNYTADIGSRPGATATTTSATATTQPQQPQQSSDYDNFVEAMGAVLRRTGWKGLLLHSGWEAYVLKQYVYHALFVAPSVLARVWRGRRDELERMQQSTPMAAGRMLLYGLLSYPLVNVMLRMALLPSSGGGASRYTSMLQCVREVAAREGWTGLYSGFGFSMLSYLVLMVLRTASLDISGWKPINRLLHH